MKIYISYFYKIRFMNRDLLPISTAKWDPKWYYKEFQGDEYVDKNGVINGIRFPELSMPSSIYNTVEKIDGGCKNCSHLSCDCTFMKAYYKYLNTLDFDLIYKRLHDLTLMSDALDVVLMVHEPATCVCAERPVLIRWFAEHGVEVKEWEKEKKL